MSDRYFTSDLHLGHPHAAKMRGFSSVAEHDEAVILSLLDLPARSKLWVLGDIAYNPQALALLHACPCTVKHAVLGNHDKMHTREYLKVFRSVEGAVRYKKLWLTHIPVHPQELYRCMGNVHGHIHKSGATKNLGMPYFNVNWDNWLRPVPYEEIQKAYEADIS